MKNLNYLFDKLFREGQSLFNKGKIRQTYLIWEKIWKCGDEEARKNIKGFIQLSGGLLNNSYGKQQAAEYLMIKAKENIKGAGRVAGGLDMASVIKQIDDFITLNHQGINCSQSVNISL